MNFEIIELEKKLAKQLDNTVSQVDVLNELAFLTISTNTSSADIYATQALAIATTINYELGIGYANLHLGMVHSGQKKYDTALPFFQAAISIFNKLHNTDGINLANAKLGNLFLFSGEYVKALTCYQVSLAIREAKNDKEGAADLYTNSGVIFGFQGDYFLSLQSHLKALNVYKEIGDKAKIASSANNIGLIHVEQHNYDEALSNFLLALAIREELGQDKPKSDLLNNIGMVYRSRNQLQEALDYYQQAKSLRENSSDESSLASSYVNIGKVYREMGQLNMAVEYYETALQLFEVNNRKRGVVQACLNLGELYFHSKSYELSEQFLLRAVRLAKELGIKNYLRDTLKILSTLYAENAEFEKAYFTFVEYSTIENDIANITTSKQIAQLSMRHEMEQVEREAKLEREKNAELQLSYSIIENEKNRSEELLHNILPIEIAAEIKADGKSLARSYDSVTVMFCDIVGFTQISETLSPHELISTLDYCYSAFDDIVKQFGIEKIKVIGDAYMCAGGVPVANNTHQVDVINAALAMRDFISSFAIEQAAKGLPVLNFRFGINTGSVIAGVVGKRKFTYDLWGDTVNVAARMEQCSEMAKINISSATYLVVKDRFKCIHRGKLAAKNKGEIDMYFAEHLE